MPPPGNGSGGGIFYGTIKMNLPMSLPRITMQVTEFIALPKNTDLNEQMIDLLPVSFKFRFGGSLIIGEIQDRDNLFASQHGGNALGLGNKGVNRYAVDLVEG